MSALNVVIAECISCVESWEAERTYGEAGYQGAIRVLKAIGEGYHAVPATDGYSVEYTHDNTSVILFKLVGFIRESANLPLHAAETTIDHLENLARHQGDIMFVTDPALLPIDYKEDDAFELISPKVDVEEQSGTVTRSWRGPEGSVYEIRIYRDPEFTTIVIGTDGQPLDSVSIGTATSHTFTTDVTDGTMRYGWVARWPDNTYNSDDMERIEFSYKAANSGAGNDISVSGWTNLSFPTQNLNYGQYNQSQHNIMMNPATQWYIDGPGDIAVESTSYGRALVARLAPTQSKGGSNQIKSAAYIPIITDRRKFRLAQRILLRDGFSFGNPNHEHTAKIGFGLRSTVDSSGGYPKDGGWSLRLTTRRKVGQSARWDVYAYTGKTTGYGTEIPAMINGNTAPVLIGTPQQFVMDVVLNDSGQDNGILQLWIDGVSVIHITNMRYQNAGNPNIRGISFTNFYGGNTPSWGPLATSYVEFFDIAYTME